MTGIQTFVLIIIMQFSGLTVPGYGSIAECEKAAQVAIKSASPLNRVFCIPGPVEVR